MTPAGGGVEPTAAHFDRGGQASLEFFIAGVFDFLNIGVAENEIEIVLAGGVVGVGELPFAGDVPTGQGAGQVGDLDDGIIAGLGEIDGEIGSGPAGEREGRTSQRAARRWSFPARIRPARSMEPCMSRAGKPMSMEVSLKISLAAKSMSSAESRLVVGLDCEEATGAGR